MVDGRRVTVKRARACNKIRQMARVSSIFSGQESSLIFAYFVTLKAIWNSYDKAGYLFSQGAVMNRFLCAIGLLTIVWIAQERSAVAQTSGVSFPFALVGHQACDPWVDYDCAPPKLSPMMVKATERNGNCDHDCLWLVQLSAFEPQLCVRV
jgi:hypothetical protein